MGKNKKRLRKDLTMRNGEGCFSLWSQGRIGKSYELGKTDCLSVVLDLCGLLGVLVPDEFEGVPKAGYAEFYRKNPDGAMEVFARWIATVADEVHPSKMFTRDILLVRARTTGTGKVSVMIHAGRNRMMSAFAGRVRRVELALIDDYEVLKVYRLRRGRNGS